MKAVADAGHEIGIHGYTHENPIAMTREQEIVVLDKCIELVTQLSGKRPTGYVAPWWEFSIVTNELLLERGIKYDHSLMHNDFRPYYVRVGDSWTKIDYSKNPSAWMKPLTRGVETDLIEIPANWYLDDLPPMMFLKKEPQQSWLCKPTPSGRDVARSVRLDLSGERLCGLSDYHPPGCVGPASSADDDRTALRTHVVAFWCEICHHE
jgi:peptidoglycan-N-acetylglucosamine deacetylase